ncbi:MAG: FAD-dependent oxidoreductase [Verrucomicrobia bacterium]|nr:FAD-dependent oxidoreductase [Verrucomicrobiota bacterium]
MNRRQFLTMAGLGTGYSLIVRADGFSSAAPPSREQISNAFDRVAPPQASMGRFAGEPHMTLVDLACDVFVAGGGMSGVCAAVAAARNGATVVLAQDRSRLGGNASSEVKMHIVGANCHNGRPGWREGGLIEEFRLDDAANNPQRSWELWDLLLYDKVKSEPNITLLLDSVLFAAETKDGAIQQVMVRCDKTEHLYRIKAKVYLDCTGDCRLALESGAAFRWGREQRTEFNESLGLVAPDKQTLGSSILFTSSDCGRPVPFTPPKWARMVTKEQLQFRSVKAWEYGYWWIEWGGQLNTIRDNERIRFELLSIVLGVWDYIKNSGNHPTSATWGMDWIGMVPGKRESRRILGDHILTQADLEGKNGDFVDAVAIGGWPMDDHPPSGFDMQDSHPCVQIKTAEVFNIPLRTLYSKTVGNLMMAGRNISATHVAFTSTRVMATCSVMGQATGTAAAFCARHGLTPRQLAQDKARVGKLQQALLRDDQTIKNVCNNDPQDLARAAKAAASAEYKTSKAANVINGFVRDMEREWKNRWGAPMTPDGAWLELAWDKPQTISRIQLTFDTGFHRQLTLTSQDSANKGIIRAPQPETVRDYEITAVVPDNDKPVSLTKATGNYQRLNRHTFKPVKVKSIRLRITATNGAEVASVYEVRCYA